MNDSPDGLPGYDDRLAEEITAKKRERRYREGVKLLRDMEPPPHPVKVQTVPLASLGGEVFYGVTDLKQRRKQRYKDPVHGTWEITPGEYYFHILLGNHLDPGDKLHTLVHEWAHAVAWDAESDHHGPVWGVVYARLYTLVFDG